MNNINILFYEMQISNQTAKKVIVSVCVNGEKELIKWASYIEKNNLKVYYYSDNEDAEYCAREGLYYLLSVNRLKKNMYPIFKPCLEWILRVLEEEKDLSEKEVSRLKKFLEGKCSFDFPTEFREPQERYFWCMFFCFDVGFSEALNILIDMGQYNVGAIAVNENYLMQKIKQRQLFRHIIGTFENCIRDCLDTDKLDNDDRKHILDNSEGFLIHDKLMKLINRKNFIYNEEETFEKVKQRQKVDTLSAREAFLRSMGEYNKFTSEEQIFLYKCWKYPHSIT